VRSVVVDLPPGLVERTGASAMTLRPMVRSELDVLLDWAAEEGWNPGLADAEVFWEADPAGFIAAEIGGRLVGGGSIVSYGGHYGFMGLFIVREELRSFGIGRSLWFLRRDLLLERLDSDGVIEMDGVLHMEAFYAKGGFTTQHRHLRFEGRAIGGARVQHGVVDLGAIPFSDIEAYDRAHFAAARGAFLQQWLGAPGVQAAGAVANGRLVGFGSARPCRVGFKIGPLFADNPEVADAIFTSLLSRIPDEAVLLDVPERNSAALDLTARSGMTEVFACARMTLGAPVALPWNEIYGVTSLELG
jgi:hypothetical protein